MDEAPKLGTWSDATIAFYMTIRAHQRRLAEPCRVTLMLPFQLVSVQKRYGRRKEKAFRIIDLRLCQMGAQPELDLTMTVLSVSHVTLYRYNRPVSFGPHRMMFRPRDSYDQKLLEAALTITPEPVDLRWLHDPFGNCVAIAGFDDRAQELRFESNIRLDHSPANVPDFQIEDYARTYPFSYCPEEVPDLVPAIERQYSDPDQEVYRWVRRFLRGGRANDTVSLLKELCCAISEDFTYERRTEPGTRDPTLSLKLGRGSCRDLALLMIEAVRSLDLAARFVSGYLYVADRDDPQLVGGGSTHAWCQVYLPGAGWVEFDPTNGIVGNRDLIRVAVARDPRQAVPLSGYWHGAASNYRGMTVEVKVRSEGSFSTLRKTVHQL